LTRSVENLNGILISTGYYQIGIKMQLIFEEALFLRSRLRVRLRGVDKVMIENSVMKLMN
jgi:hypothetical protein